MKTVLEVPFFGAMELRADKRISKQHMIPDKKTKKFLRAHPDTLRKLEEYVKKSNLNFSTEARKYAFPYATKVLPSSRTPIMGLRPS